MNTLRRTITVALLTLVTLGAVGFTLVGNWSRTAGPQSVTYEYLTYPNGSRSAEADYDCLRDLQKMEDGSICHIGSRTVFYTTKERIIETTILVMLVLIVGGIVTSATFSVLTPRTNETTSAS